MRPSRNARFAAPFVVAALIGLGAGLPHLASGTHAHLRPVSAVALTLKMAGARADGLSGTLSFTSDIGLPASLAAALPGGASSASVDWTALLSGTHELRVWVSGTQLQRVSLSRRLGESDVIHNGTHIWIWDSTTQQVTDIVTSGAPGRSGHAPASAESTASLNPVVLASELLSHLGSGTSLATGPPVVVAGQAAYLLRLAPAPGSPDARDSTVGRIEIAVDAANGLPLRIQVFSAAAIARPGVAKAALSLGFVGHVSFARPGEGEFAAPHGVSEVTESLAHVLSAASSTPAPNGARPAGAGLRVVGSVWAPVLEVPDIGVGSTSSIVRLLTVPDTSAPGSPRLLRAGLVNALIYPDGELVAGFATEDALASAAART